MEMDYGEYSNHYDTLCEINPAYQELIFEFQTELSRMHLPANPLVCDLGAGTGNFICSLIKELPNAKVLHVDCNPEMNAIAKQKYQANDYEVEIIESYMQVAPLNKNSLDLVICVNALNNAPPAGPMLNRISNWIAPGGYLFLVDTQ